jgi:hypothetical protein
VSDRESGSVMKVVNYMDGFLSTIIGTMVDGRGACKSSKIFSLPTRLERDVRIRGEKPTPRTVVSRQAQGGICITIKDTKQIFCGTFSH